MAAGHNGKGEGYAPVCFITQVQLAVVLYAFSGQMFTCIHALFSYLHVLFSLPNHSFYYLPYYGTMQPLF